MAGTLVMEEIFSLMFAGNPYFNQDISKWDVSSGNNFKGMLSNMYSFNYEVSNWDVSSGTNFNSMFFGDGLYLNPDVSNWDVSSGRDFGQMFSTQLVLIRI